ncbi:MAG: hypothetical protein D6767_03015 [Candidatus Hydrogenedentota bacterium]|nr:MAG: hypothetical protein D6767_03015 [Candidatus Hydrogenedentota bacterium]
MRASTLFLVLVIMAVVSAMLASLIALWTTQQNFNVESFSFLKARISANSYASAFWYYKQLDSEEEIPATVKAYFLCPVKEKKKENNAEVGNVYFFTFQATCNTRLGQVSYTTQLDFLSQNYSAYLISSSGDLLLASQSGMTRYFLGPIFAGGNLILKDGGMNFFVKPEWESAAILTGKDILLLDKWKEYRNKLSADLNKDEFSLSAKEKRQREKEKELLKKVSRLIEPIYIGFSNFRITPDYPLHHTNIREVLPDLIKKVKAGNYSDLLSLHHSKVYRLKEPILGPMIAKAELEADEKYIFTSLHSEVANAVRIPNGHLLEKRLIGIGTGSELSFPLPYGHSPITRVFLKPLGQKERTKRYQKVHPVHDLEGVLGREFVIRKNSLVFLKPSKKIQLGLPSNAFDMSGRILLRSADGSAVSAARSLEKLYFEYLGHARELTPEDFRIDDSTGELFLLNPDIRSKVWVEVGTTDGVRRIYSTTLNFGEIVYLNGKISDGRVVPGNIVFPSTPPAGQKIEVMILKPKLFAQKLPPEFGVGVFIDKDIKALDLDLSRLFPIPSGGIIVSHVPLFVHGTPPRRISIFSTKDVYVGDINRNEANAHFVLIATNGMIWGQRFRKAIELRRVILLSAADGIFLNLTADPFIAKRDKAEKSIFVGSLYLAGRLKNLFYYPDLAISKAYYYHPGRQADFNFFYDDALAEPEFWPLYMPTSIHLLRRSY